MTNPENSLTDDQMQTVQAGGSVGYGDADSTDSAQGGDADATDSATTQVDPAGVDPSGADSAQGGDADATDNASS